MIVKKDKECIRCEMSIMNPLFLELEVVGSSLAYKYRLFQYYDEENFTSTNGKTCNIVLFVPGSVGSYRQVRSLGSAILKNSVSSKSECFNIFAVDFRQEFVAFSPRLLSQQAKFVNDVIKNITTENTYKNIFLVGHSFGGIVLRLLHNLPNYGLSDIQFNMITIATPHKGPPISTTPEFERLYASLPVISNGTLKISSGYSDILVPPHLSESRRVNEITHVWSEPHHQAMIWEKRLISYLADHVLNGGSNIRPDSSTTQIAELLKCRLYDGSSITREEVCLKGISDVCLIYKGTSLNVFTVESDIEVFFGSVVSFRDDGILIENSQSVDISRTSYPGKSTIFDTKTNAKTELTQLLTHIQSTSGKDGIYVLKINCNNRIVAGWDQDWHHKAYKFDTMQSSTLHQSRTTILGNARVQKLTITLWNMFILGRHFGISKDNPTIIVKVSNESASPIRLRIKTGSRDQDLLLMAKSRDGSPSFAYRASPSEYIMTIDSRTDGIECVYFGLSSMNIEIKVDILHTLLLFLVKNIDSCLTLLYPAMVISNWKASYLILPALFTLQTRNYDATSLLLAAISSVLMLFLINSLKSFSIGKNASKREKRLSVVILLLPLDPAMRILLVVLATLTNDVIENRQLSMKTIKMIFVFVKPLMIAIANLRNTMVLISDLGLPRVLSHEFSLIVRMSLHELCLLSLMLFIVFERRSKRFTLPRAVGVVPIILASSKIQFREYWAIILAFIN